MEERFINEDNRRSAVTPEVSEKAWQSVPRDVDIGRSISFPYYTMVENDNIMRLGGIVIDIPKGSRQSGYAKAKTKIRQLLNDSRSHGSSGHLFLHINL